MAEPKAKRVQRVEDVMTRDPVCVGGDATVRELGELFVANDISGVPVVDGQDRVIGVVSKTDLVRQCLEGPQGSPPSEQFFEALGLIGASSGSDWDPRNLGVVEEFMSDQPVTATPEENVAQVARRMARERVHRVVVVDSHMHPIGIVTTLDLLGYFPEP